MASLKLTEDELKIIAKEIYRLMRDEYGCGFKHFTYLTTSKGGVILSND